MISNIKKTAKKEEKFKLWTSSYFDFKFSIEVKTFCSWTGSGFDGNSFKLTAGATDRFANTKTITNTNTPKGIDSMHYALYTRQIWIVFAKHSL